MSFSVHGSSLTTHAVILVKPPAALLPAVPSLTQPIHAGRYQSAWPSVADEVVAGVRDTEDGLPRTVP